MGSRINQLLLGVIMLLIGLFALFRPTVIFSFGAVMFTICGLAFVLLYHTKRKSWSLVLGGYLLYFGMMGFVQPYIRIDEAINFIGTMFFIVPSVIFLILYYDKDKRGLLLPSMLMMWFGIFLFTKDLAVFIAHGGLLFITCFGFAFMLTYLLGRGCVRRGVLFFGLALIAVGFIFFGGLSAVGVMLRNLPQLLPIVLILASGAVIIRALRRR